MATAARAGATSLHQGLPDEIVFWEILVHLPPEFLLQCRTVCRAWRHVTSTRDFLLAHHARQPTLPIVHGFEYTPCDYDNILTFDHRADTDAKLQTVARLAKNIYVTASCDGLLILYTGVMFGSCFTVCNPVTREHALLRESWGSTLLGMYPHHPTGEYRLLLHRSSYMRSSLGHVLPNEKIGCYVFALGSDQPLRYLEGAEAETAASERFEEPALLRDRLHWYQEQHENENELILVFDTINESFRRMRPPVVPGPTTTSHIFETEGMLGICGYDDATNFVDIWVLQSYESEVWEHKYRVKLPIAEMRGEFGSWDNSIHVRVASMDGDLLLLVRFDLSMFYVDTGGKVVDCFHHDSQQLYPSDHRLKQTLVPHTFFSEQEGHAATKSPFV